MDENGNELVDTIDYYKTLVALLSNASIALTPVQEYFFLTSLAVAIQPILDEYKSLIGEELNKAVVDNINHIADNASSDLPAYSEERRDAIRRLVDKRLDSRRYVLVYVSGGSVQQVKSFNSISAAAKSFDTSSIMDVQLCDLCIFEHTGREVARWYPDIEDNNGWLFHVKHKGR